MAMEESALPTRIAFILNAANSSSTVITTYIAIYGAVLSTITAISQILAYRRDRAHIKVSMARDMEVVGQPGYEGVALAIITAVNTGRRPVTIMKMGIQGLYPHKSWIAIDTRPKLPHELTEGKHVDALMEQRGIDFSNAEACVVSDATGRKYTCSIAPWYKRLWSRTRRNLAKS
jgi:hypothetical protein